MDDLKDTRSERRCYLASNRENNRYCCWFSCIFAAHNLLLIRHIKRSQFCLCCRPTRQEANNSSGCRIQLLQALQDREGCTYPQVLVNDTAKPSTVRINFARYCLLIGWIIIARNQHRKLAYGFLLSIIKGIGQLDKELGTILYVLLCAFRLLASQSWKLDI